MFEHRCWPRRTGRSGTTALYRRNSVGTRAQPPNLILAHSRWPQPTKVSRYIGLSAYGMSDYRYGAYTAYEAYRPRPLA